MDLDKWDLTVLNNLVKYRGIERDNFDFKGKDIIFAKQKNDLRLEHQLCAMANILTGILCLGVDDPVSETNPTSTFRPNGFRNQKNTEQETLNSINNFVVKVDPIPKVTSFVLPDEERDSFYVILKVKCLVNQRPYIIKDKGQIFVRIRDSTMPASRTTIANLFVNQLERRNSVRNLQVHCKLLRNEIIQTAKVIDTIDSNYTGIIPQLDLQSFKSAVSSAEWFLSERGILGQVNTTGPTVEGLYTNLHELNALKTTIDIFNNEQMNRPGRYTAFCTVFDKWKTHRNEFNYIIGSLDDIDQRCTRFIQSS